MSNLPVLMPYDQAVAAEALAYAKEELKKYYSINDNPWTGTDAPLVSVETGRAFMHTYVENMLAMDSAFARLQVIEMAKAGITEAADALHELVVEATSSTCRTTVGTASLRAFSPCAPQRSLAEEVWAEKDR